MGTPPDGRAPNIGEQAVQLEHTLADDVREGLFGIGAQAALHRDGALVASLAIGSCAPSTAMTTSTLQNVWCASKPLLAMAVLLHAESGRLNLDRAIGDQFCDHESLRLIRASPSQVLSHSGGMSKPRAFEAMLMRPADRLNAVATNDVLDIGYSEYAGWRVLDEVLSTLNNTSAAAVVRRDVLEPLGISDDAILDVHYNDHAEVDARVGAVFPQLPLNHIASQHDTVLYLSRFDRVVMGALMTAAALATFYGKLLEVYRGGRVDGLPSQATLLDALGRTRGHIHDSVLERECDFAAGFMINLAAHGMSAHLPPDSFGHSGMSGSIFALANPRTASAIAVVFNGANADIDDARLLYRRYSEFCA